MFCRCEWSIVLLELRCCEDHWTALLPLNYSPSPPPLRNRESKLSVVDDYSFLLLSPREADWYLGQINSRQIRGKNMHSLNDMRNLTKKIAVNFMSCLANVTFFHFNDREILLKIFFYVFLQVSSLYCYFSCSIWLLESSYSPISCYFVFWPAARMSDDIPVLETLP